MNAADLIEKLEYRGSPCFLGPERLDEDPSYAHIFRRARKTCALQGVYTLSDQAAVEKGLKLTPVVYVCEAPSDTKASEIHRKVWNQNVIPFVIVVTPKDIRLYPGFKYAPSRSGGLPQPIEIATSVNDVLHKLGDLKAPAIDAGEIWQSRAEHVTPQHRVDWCLLKNLKDLGDWLHKNGLHRQTAHALIGKYVYLRYLRDRDILSDRKLAEWDMRSEEVFGRNATLKGFRSVVNELDDWLNGSVFPLPSSGDMAPAASHVRHVAATFLGDEPKSGQMHLDFQAYDFSFIPIEALSIVYQQFLHAEGKGRQRGAYYTPLHLVNFMLDELDAKRPLAEGMKVFDPACGSGAFLVQAYRRLIERQSAKSDRERLPPSQLRELLVGHIFGLDSDVDACRVAELSLILTLLDYVEPPDLKRYPTFQIPVLEGENIFHGDFFDAKSTWRKAMPDARFDWIVSNPPWRELKPKKPEPGEAHAIRWMEQSKTTHPIGGNQLAEAFAWEVTRVAAGDGLIGLLMPAMTLFKAQSRLFRRKFFSHLDVWCVVNFANLAEVLFAGRARLPAAALFYSKPIGDGEVRREPILTYAPFVVTQLPTRPGSPGKRGETWSVVVNSNEIRQVSMEDAATGDSLAWKIAMWGTSKDRWLLKSLAKRFPSLSKFKSTHGLAIHQGLELRDSTVTEPIEHVEELVGKDELDMGALRGCGSIYIFPENALKRVKSDRGYVRQGRNAVPLSVSRPPHIIVDAARRFAVYTDQFIVVPARQIGIAGTKQNKSLLRALSLFLSSTFVKYHQFMLSPQWGIQKTVTNKATLEMLPVPLGELSGAQSSRWVQLHGKLVAASQRQQNSSMFTDSRTTASGDELSDLEAELDSLVYDLLGLDKAERSLVHDLIHERLKLNQGKWERSAIQPATQAEMQSYAQVLCRELDGFLDEGIKRKHQVRVVFDDQSAWVEVALLPKRNGPRITVAAAEGPTATQFQELRERLLKRHRQWVYFNRGLRVFEGRKVHLFKPRQRLDWLQSQALLDADELIAETLSGSGG